MVSKLKCLLALGMGFIVRATSINSVCDSVKVDILEPSHGSYIRLDQQLNDILHVKVKTGGFTNVCIQSLPAAKVQICGVVNGSLVGCGHLDISQSNGATEDVQLPVSTLHIGMNWLTFELINAYFHDGDDRKVLASTRPIKLKGQIDDHSLHSLNETNGQDIVEKINEHRIHINSATRTSCSSVDKYPSVTMVLTLTLVDLPRALVLLSSLGTLQYCSNSWQSDHETDHSSSSSTSPSSPPPPLPRCWLKSLLIIVPDDEQHILRTLLAPPMESDKVKVIAESTLLGFKVKLRRNELPFNIDGYAVQMALKLLVANIIDSDYYLTLDADIITTRTFNPSDLFSSSFHDGNIFESGASGTSKKWQAVYTPEDQNIHKHWWEGSANLLEYYQGSGVDASEDRLDHGSHLHYRPYSTAKFGVTPAVLSTSGSMFVLKRLEELFSLDSDERSFTWVEKWLMKWGGPNFWWSEYTLYALALHQHKIFHHLHQPARQGVEVEEAVGMESSRAGDGGDDNAATATATTSVGGGALSCHSTWFADEVKQWKASDIFRPLLSFSKKHVSVAIEQTSIDTKAIDDSTTMSILLQRRKIRDSQNVVCPFSVVQSSSGIDPAEIAAQVKYELNAIVDEMKNEFGSDIFERKPPHFSTIFNGCRE